MKYGPFPMRDVEPIEEVLQEMGISYEKSIDTTQMLEELENRKRLPPSDIPHPAMDPACGYFEIDERDVEKLGIALEPFGIISSLFQPDLNAADYYCLKCKHVAPVPGVCPKQHGMLVHEDEYRKLKEQAEDQSRKHIWIFLRVFFIGFVASAVWALFFR